MEKDKKEGNECHKIKMLKNEEVENSTKLMHKEREKLRRWDPSC